MDDYPSHYLAFAARQHRWVRGDWQIVRWLWRTVPDAARRPVPNTLPVISRWKILDNLRRSLLSPALVVLLAAGWTILPGSPLLWTVLAVLVLAFPAYVQVARSLSSRARGVPLRAARAAERDNLVTSARQSLLSADVPGASELADGRCDRPDALAPARDAAAGGCEWVSADQLAAPESLARSGRPPDVGGGRHRDRAAVLVGDDRSGAPAAGAADDRALAALARHRVRHRQAARARAAAARCRRAGHSAEGRTQDVAVLRRSAGARRTTGWSRTTTRRIATISIAHRTSPTNIGLQLISTLAAYDFGYLSFRGVVDRLEPTFATLLKSPPLPRSFLQLVRHTDAGAARARRTSPRSTAATSPATC